MEVVFYIDQSSRVIIEHFRGDVTLSKAGEVFAHIWNHPKYSPAYDGIIDLRDCNVLFSNAELHAMVTTIAEDSHGMRGRAAILVSEPISAAVGSLYSDQMKNIHSAAIFCTNSDVIKFLGVDRKIFEKLDDPDAVKVIID